MARAAGGKAAVVADDAEEGMEAAGEKAEAKMAVAEADVGA